VDIQGTHSPARLVVRTYHNTPQLMTTHCLQVSNNHTCILGDLYVEKLAWCARGKQQTHLKRALWVLLCAFYYEHRQSQTRQNHLHGISEEARLQHKKCACECHRFGVDILPGACIALPYATASLSTDRMMRRHCFNNSVTPCCGSRAQGGAVSHSREQIALSPLQLPIP
jgi:hypothetical protein